MGTDEKSPKKSLLSPAKEPGISSLAWRKLYFNNKRPTPKNTRGRNHAHPNHCQQRPSGEHNFYPHLAIMRYAFQSTCGSIRESQFGSLNFYHHPAVMSYPSPTTSVMFGEPGLRYASVTRHFLPSTQCQQRPSGESRLLLLFSVTEDGVKRDQKDSLDFHSHFMVTRYHFLTPQCQWGESTDFNPCPLVRHPSPFHPGIVLGFYPYLVWRVSGQCLHSSAGVVSVKDAKT